MKDIDTNKLQLKLLDIMVEFHKVCIQHNLRYYLLGGSMLGAVRHKGFIPWDDDMDVGMPREDYEKFLKLPQDVWPNNLQVNTPYISKNWIIPFSKLVDTNTTLVEEGITGPVVGGIYLDVFPLDGAGNNMLHAKFRYMIFAIKRRLIVYNLIKEEKSNPLEKLIQKYAKKQNAEKLHIKLEKWMKKINYDNSKIIGNYAGAWGTNEFMIKDIMGKPKLYQFEEHSFYGVNNYDDYLTSLYGDYMELPPMNKRVSHHIIVYISLSYSYNTYESRVNL